MKFKQSILKLVAYLSLVASPALAQETQTVPEPTSPKPQATKAAPGSSISTSLEVYESSNDLVLVEPEGPRKLVAPRKLQTNGRYIIRMKKDAPLAAVEEKPKQATQEELIKARKYLFDANEAFFKGDLQKAWSMIDEAEKLDPENYRIKSMKGSLLYRTGSKDLAIPLWEQSLAINPDQPEIRRILEKSKEELKL